MLNGALVCSFVRGLGVSAAMIDPEPSKTHALRTAFKHNQYNDHVVTQAAMERKHQEDLAKQKATLLAEKQEWQKRFTSKVCYSSHQAVAHAYATSDPNCPTTGGAGCRRPAYSTGGP